jgi:ferredoxin
MYSLEIIVIFYMICLLFNLVNAWNISPNRILLHANHQQQISKQTLYAKKTYKVTIKHDGMEKTLDVREDCSILDAALDNDINLPHDCKLGVCLTCPSRIISGKVDQSGGTLDDSVVEKGYALTCMSFPQSDVVVTSIDEDELVSAQFEKQQ